MILCSHGAEVLGSALESALQTLQEVIREDTVVISVGFAMDALARLAQVCSEDKAVLPLISDLRANLPALLSESPIQCWEAPIRQGFDESLLQSEEWPPNFIEKTAGAWQGEELVQPEQSEYETGLELL